MYAQSSTPSPQPLAPSSLATPQSTETAGNEAGYLNDASPNSVGTTPAAISSANLSVKSIRDLPPFDSGSTFLDKYAVPFYTKMGDYHDFKIMGLERIPKKGGVLITLPHSFYTFDCGMIISAISLYRQQRVKVLVDHTMMTNPGLNNLLTSLGCEDGRFPEALAALRKGEAIVVFPGGMSEANSDRAHRVDWMPIEEENRVDSKPPASKSPASKSPASKSPASKTLYSKPLGPRQPRLGFATLAMTANHLNKIEHQEPVHLISIANPHGDDLLHLTSSDNGPAAPVSRFITRELVNQTHSPSPIVAIDFLGRNTIGPVAVHPYFPYISPAIPFPVEITATVNKPLPLPAIPEHLHEQLLTERQVIDKLSNDPKSLLNALNSKEQAELQGLLLHLANQTSAPMESTEFTRLSQSLIDCIKESEPPINNPAPNKLSNSPLTHQQAENIKSLINKAIFNYLDGEYRKIRKDPQLKAVTTDYVQHSQDLLNTSIQQTLALDKPNAIFPEGRNHSLWAQKHFARGVALGVTAQMVINVVNYLFTHSEETDC